MYRTCPPNASGALNNNNAGTDLNAVTHGQAAQHCFQEEVVHLAKLVYNWVK
jgi:hypothetical protein